MCLSYVADFNVSEVCFGTDITQMHEIVSDRSWRAENSTNLPQISMRVFFSSKNVEKCHCGQKQKNAVVRDKIFEKLHGPYQSCKKQKEYRI